MSSSDTTALQGKVLLAARLLVTPLFIYSGIGKILAFEATAGRLPGGAGGFGSVLAAIAIVIELGGSLALILGVYARCAAIALMVFTILATVMFHNFWASPPAQVTAQTINFLKNLGLIGLFAMIAAFGPGAYALRKK
jgi:putative oxidoreductase